MKTTVIVINQNYKKNSNIIQRDHCLCAYEDDEGDSNIEYLNQNYIKKKY